MTALRQFSTTISTKLPSGPSLTIRPSVCIFCQYGFASSASPIGRATFSTLAKRPQNGTTLTRQSRHNPINTSSGNVDCQARQLSGATVPRTRIDENYPIVDEAQMRQDARFHAQQLRLEKKIAFQAQVEDAPMHQDYVPATTWNGLDTVGGETEWNTGKKFHGFLPAEKLKTAEEVTVAIYRAVVEVFAALGAGRAPRTSKFYNIGPLVNEALQVKIELTKADDAEGEGKVRLSYPSSVVEQAVLKAGVPTIATSGGPVSTIDIEGEGIALDIGPEDLSEAPSYTTESLNTMIKSWGRSWLHIPLTDPKVKFAIIKRVNRLSGAPISDHIIHNAQSVAWLVSGLVKNKGPQKLFEVLNSDANLTRLPNVKVMGRRETPVDKEKQVGRWKLIEAELRRRDLPVLGRG